MAVEIERRWCSHCKSMRRGLLWDRLGLFDCLWCNQATPATNPVYLSWFHSSKVRP